jgi:hypothetical protein
MPLSLDERLPRCGLLPVLRGHIVGGIPPAHRASQGLPQRRAMFLPAVP